MAMPRTDTAAKAFEILVIDDEPEIRELLTEHLRARGYRTATAGDGLAAVSLIQRSGGQFGLILTDLSLPGLDGLAVLKAARAASPSAQVVIITGYASLDSAIAAVRLGAYDYLTKPFSLGQIDVLLARVEDRLALEAENRALLRRIDTRETETAHSAQDRLGALEVRLAAIEHALRDLTTELTRRRL
ncbi:MAG: response regulator [Vicinamibacterales bacterium]